MKKMLLVVALLSGMTAFGASSSSRGAGTRLADDPYIQNELAHERQVKALQRKQAAGTITQAEQDELYNLQRQARDSLPMHIRQQLYEEAKQTRVEK